MKTVKPKKGKKRPDLVEIERFYPSRQPWPSGVKPWPDEKGSRPRDMSVGYIDTLEGRKSVRIFDWILTDADGNKYLRDDETIQLLKTRDSTESTALT